MYYFRALQGLKLIADGLLVPQSHIIIESPSYIHSIRTWHNIHAELKSLPISTIKRNINHIFNHSQRFRHSLFYTIPTCHNPTQHSYSIEERKKSFANANYMVFQLLKMTYMASSTLIDLDHAH